MKCCVEVGVRGAPIEATFSRSVQRAEFSNFVLPLDIESFRRRWIDFRRHCIVSTRQCVDSGPDGRWL